MSDTIQKKISQKLPWVMGKRIRIPRIKFPMYREGQLSLPSPGRSLVLIATYIFLFWLVMGGIYMSIRDPIAMGSDASNNALWLYPSTNEAFIIESIVAATLIFVAGAGFFILYSATKEAVNYPYAIKLLILGVGLVGIAFGLLQYMLAVKSGTFNAS